jgi:hypothetical protein
MASRWKEQEDWQDSDSSDDEENSVTKPQRTEKIQGEEDHNLEEDSGTPSDNEDGEEEDRDCDQEEEIGEEGCLSRIIARNRVVCAFRNKGEGQHPEHHTKRLTTAIGGLLHSPMEATDVEGTGSDDPLLNCLVHLRQLPKEVYQRQELEELKCEKSVGPSHVDDGGGDTHQPKQSNHWLFREQLEITQHESAFEIKRGEQKVRLRVLKHSLSQESRLDRIVHQVQYMDPGRARDRVIEEFWISVHNGSYHPDCEMLERREWASAEYFCLCDEVLEQSPQVGMEQGADLGTQLKRRSGAVTGIGDLALE